MDNRTKLLLKYAKSEDFDSTWAKVAEVLKSMYCGNMKLLDVFHHVFEAFNYVSSDCRFQTCLGYDQLMTAPVQGMHSLDMLGCTKDTKYTVEQFYQSMISAMLGQLRCTRVDWCKEELK